MYDFSKNDLLLEVQKRILVHLFKTLRLNTNKENFYFLSLNIYI